MPVIAEKSRVPTRKNKEKARRAEMVRLFYTKAFFKYVLKRFAGVEQLTLTFIYGAVTDKSVWINELSKDGEGQRSLA